MNRVVWNTALPHARYMVRFTRHGHPFDHPDGVDPGKVRVKIERAHIAPEPVAIDRSVRGKQALHASQHKLVGRHALFDATYRITHGVIKLSAKLFASRLPFVIPYDPGHAERRG